MMKISSKTSFNSNYEASELKSTSFPHNFRSTFEHFGNATSSFSLMADRSLGVMETPSSPPLPILRDPSWRRPSESLNGAVMPSNQKVAKSDRYKTELCRPFSENGTCRYGEKCQFAHGTCELRTVSRHPKYKTDLCRTFHSTGFCPYGSRCHFVHGERNPTMDTVGKPNWNDDADATRFHVGFSEVARASRLDRSEVPPVSDSASIQQLLLGIQTLLNLERGSPVYSTSAVSSFSLGTATPGDGLQPTTFHDDPMGSTATSPTFSVTDSPNPSPTSMISTGGDIWSSIVNLIGVGV